MSSSDMNFFVSGSSQSSQDKPELDFSLYHAYPIIDDDRDTSSVLTKGKRHSPVSGNKNLLAEDGLYVSENLFTDKLIKPYYRLDNVKSPLRYESRSQFRGKLVEIAVRKVRIHNEEEGESREKESRSMIEIVSVSILFKTKLICKANSPFNRKLHKLLIRDPECHNLSIQVNARHGESSVLPLPLPQRCVRDHQIDIDFAIGGENSDRIYAGTATCTISVSPHGVDQIDDSNNNERVYRPSNDPNDPHNSLFLLRPQKSRQVVPRKDVTYFSLEDPDLLFNTGVNVIPRAKSRRESVSKSPDIVVTEQPVFSLLNVSLKNIFQANRPLRPTSGTRRHHAIGKTVLAVTVLRGIEVPVREESALVSPLLEVQWGDVVRTTSVADGPAPVWQQTMHFELPRQNGEHSVRFRLYDQHPVWGQQWLGEARIPLERHRNYQELERWVALSPLFSPVLLFGYVQASPGQSHTRIYVLVRMEQPGNANSVEAGAIDTLSKGIQRCLAIPYKIIGVETPDDAARLAMLLSSLPVHYGPVTPRQALNVNKVDHYGRAALLATLLQGFSLQSYVLLGSSQISKWTAFVLSIEENDVVLWDPEIGDYYKLSDSRCSLMRVSRLINHLGIWENTQKSVLPHNLKYNVTLGKDWRPLVPIAASTASRSVQTLELTNNVEDATIGNESAEMEQYLRDKLAGWRSALGLTTMFNRHAISVLRDFLSGIPSETGRFQLDRKDLKQLYRVYHVHGFLLNLRQTALDELADQLAATKVKDVTGPIEFALVCHVQRYIGKTCSIWMALAILRSRG